MHRTWLLVIVAACGKSSTQPAASAGSGSGSGSGSASAVASPDAAVSHPDAAALPDLAGTYQLDIAWPAIKCAVKPPAKQAVTIDVDRDAAGSLRAAGTPWQVDEVRANGTSQIYLRTFMKTAADGDHPYEQLLLLDVSGTQVTGTAELSQSPTGMGDDTPLCKPASAKVRGTRASTAAAEPDCDLVCRHARDCKSTVMEGLSESDCLKSCIRAYDQDDYYPCMQRAAGCDAARQCTSTLH